MADHLLLPERIALASRRQGPAGGPGSPERNPRRHGRRLEREIQDAVAAARPVTVIEGVDPGLVFKVRASGRITDETWGHRQVALLGDTDDWTYFVLSEDEVPERLLAELRRYSTGPDEMGGRAPLRTFFNAVEDIQPYGPEDRRTPSLPDNLRDLGEPILVDAVAWPSPTPQEAQRRLRNIRRVLAFYGGQEIASDARARFTVLRARLSGEGVEGLLHLPVVEKVRTPPIPFIEPSDWWGRTADDVEVIEEPAEPIAIIDDGIADGHPLLAGAVASRRAFPPGYAWSAIGSHGTMVAGLAAFGDFEGPLRSQAPLVRRGVLHEARVLEPHPDLPHRTRFAPDITEHQAVEEAIETLHREEGVRVFSMSINDPDSYSGPHVSVFTERIDELIREHEIVVVLSAGNHGVEQLSATMDSGDHAEAGYPAYVLHEQARVAEPAPAALALTVGSLARSDAPQTPTGAARVGDQAIAECEQVSPFSRTGPGAFRGVKPDVVEFGGNWVINDSGMLETENVGVGVISLGVNESGRLFTVSSGTSFAAPRVARVAADIWTSYPDASANLVRALLAVSARIPGAAVAQFPEDATRLRAVGYGRPIRNLALESGGNRVVMYFDGEMQTDTVAIHPVPIPPSFSRGRATRRIAVSLAFDPHVRRQRREYLAGEMSFDLLRNVTPDAVRQRYGRQGEGRLDLFTDRRRLGLAPGSTRTANSTLQLRHFTPRELNPDDGDVYYLAIKHRPAPWARAGMQRYAVAVELVEEERLDVDLYAEVQQQVQVPARLRIRR